jgi:type I restriction enzyme S subunit
MKSVRLEEIVDICSSKRIKMSEYVTSGIPFYRSKEIINLHKNQNIQTELFITEERFDEINFKSGAPIEGDILLTSVGTLGVPYQVKKDDKFYFKDGNLTWFRNFSNDVNKRYFYFWLTSPIAKRKFDEITIGSTQKALTIVSLKGIEIDIPDITEQNKIAEVIGEIQEKIELNQKMNETLEEIAKTLFKSWFIDFDPVRAKAEGRPTGLSNEISDLFPDSFEDSEFGEIPRGWKLSNLDSNLEFVLGGDWGKEELSDDFNKEVVCIRGADIPNLQTFIESNPPKRFIKESSLEKRKLKEGDLVLEISGGSPTQSTGRIVYITEEFLSTQDCPVVFSNFCRILRSDSTLSKYIYYYLRSLYDSDKLFQYETGTTGIKNFGYKYFSEEVFFALPNFDLLTIFSELIETFLIKKGTNLKEIITLTNLRDILLPKLISGELKIPDAENLVEKAGI